MDVDTEEPTIKILVLAEKRLSKRHFINSFRKCLMYESFDECEKMEGTKQTDVRDTFNARYKRICFIDTPEVNPNASLSANLSVIRLIKYSIHFSGHLNGIICLLHHDPIYYENFLEFIFTHLFTTDLIPKIMKKLLFVFVDRPFERTLFQNFLQKFGTGFNKTSWISSPVTLVDVNASSDKKQREDEWTKSSLCFQKIFEKIVKSNVDIVQLECKFSNESVSKVVDNFLDILTEISFIIEDNTLTLEKYSQNNTNYTYNGYNNYTLSLKSLDSFNYCISICRSPKCVSKNMGICCECKSVSKPSNIRKCTSFMPPSNVCTKCECSISKHDAVPYKLTTKSVNMNQDTIPLTQKKRRFVIDAICVLTVIKEWNTLSKTFKKRLQEKIEMDTRPSSPYKNIILLFEEAMTQLKESQTDISVNDVLKCIETAEQYSLISSEYRNAFLAPDIELVPRNCDVGDGNSNKKNFNLSNEDKELKEMLNNFNI